MCWIGTHYVSSICIVPWSTPYELIDLRISGVAKHNVTFFASTSLSVIGSLMLLIGASIWTVLIKKSEGINDFVIGPNNNPVPLGIVVSVGSGLYMVWAAFACMLISIVPYMVR
jgi:hypothetical protein